MYRSILKSLVLTAVGVLVAVPAFAQIRVDLGPLNIRIASDAPPPVRYERQTARPDRDSVWIKGSWDRQDDKWAWVSGRWDKPSDPNSRWVNAKYSREGQAWRYEPAHWSQQQVVEGDDYRKWKDDHRSDRDRH
jgi:WXXGXW repeat (2 copies)